MDSKKASAIPQDTGKILSNFLKVNERKHDLSEIYGWNEYVHLNRFKLFAKLFPTVPNVRFEHKIKCDKVNDWLQTTYKEFILDFHSTQTDQRFGSKKMSFEWFYYLYDDLLVHIDTGRSNIHLLYRKTDFHKVEEIIRGITKFKKGKERHKPEISLLIQTFSGIETRTLSVVKPKLQIEDNYNDDLREFHQTIIKRLSKKNDKGLVLLHGKPGTGKTSYIRYLISSVKKDVVFLPPNLASAITNPSLISSLVDNPNSIFVIEDAENIVMNREVEGNSPVSALLNISDGLLSDCLNIQVICSFNTDLSKIDSALMRKGRLIAKYEFRELETEKAQRLSDKLGFSTSITRPMTLTEIYNQEEKEYEPINGNSYIGFKSVSFN